MGHIGEKGGLGAVGDLGRLQGLRKLSVVDFPFLLPFPADSALLFIREKVQKAADHKGCQHHHHNDENILVDRLALPLDGFGGDIPDKIEGASVHGPDIDQGLTATDIMIKHHVFSVPDGISNLLQDILLQDVVGTVKILQVQMAGIPLSKPLGL